MNLNLVQLLLNNVEKASAASGLVISSVSSRDMRSGGKERSGKSSKKRDVERNEESNEPSHAEAIEDEGNRHASDDWSRNNKKDDNNTHLEPIFHPLLDPFDGQSSSSLMNQFFNRTIDESINQTSNLAADPPYQPNADTDFESNK
jgi:hypothetical protein